MGAVGPASVDVGVAVDAVGVVHQRPLGNEAAARGARQGREEVLLARLRTFHVPRPRILELQHQRHPDQDHGGDRHARADPPADALPREPVQHEQPGSHQRRQDVQPVGHAADRRIVHRDHALDPRQHDAAQKEHERRPEQRVPHLHGAPVRTIPRVAHMRPDRTRSPAPRRARPPPGEAETSRCRTSSGRSRRLPPRLRGRPRDRTSSPPAERTVRRPPTGAASAWGRSPVGSAGERAASRRPRSLSLARSGCCREPLRNPGRRLDLFADQPVERPQQAERDGVTGAANPCRRRLAGDPYREGVSGRLPLVGKERSRHNSRGTACPDRAPYPSSSPPGAASAPPGSPSRPETRPHASTRAAPAARTGQEPRRPGAVRRPPVCAARCPGVRPPAERSSARADARPRGWRPTGPPPAV